MHSTFAAFFFLCIQALNAQDPKPVAIGQQCPDFEIKHVTNRLSKTIRLSDLRGKLVLLDFWSSGCLACFSAFPRLEAIQKQFGDRIQILCVNSFENQQQVRRRVKPEVLKKLPDLPVSIGDTSLRKYFPHRLTPHHVWIDGAGKLLASTSGEFASACNIDAVLKGEKLSFLTKDDSKIPDGTNGIFQPSNQIFQENMLYTSSLAGYIPFLSTSSRYYRDSVSGRKIGLRFLNQPAVNLLVEAFKNGYVFNPFDDAKRVILRLKENSAREGECYQQQMAYLYNNRFSYEIMVNPRYVDKFDRFMQEDLNQKLMLARGIRGRIEKHMKRSLVISFDGSGGDHNLYKPLFTNTPKLESSYSADSLPFDSFVHKLQIRLQSDPRPVVDQTGLQRTRVNIHLPCTTDIECINSGLKHFGLQLVEKEVEIDMLIIEEF